MKKIIPTFPLLLLFSICMAQENVEYSIKLLPPVINNPAYDNFNASMNDSQNRICFVRRLKGSNFSEIVISNKNTNGEWSNPTKIYPTEEKVFSWKKGQLTKDKYSQAYAAGNIVFPDYKIEPEPELRAVSIEDGSIKRWSIKIISCKINNEGRLILFQIFNPTFSRDLVGSLTEQLDGTWSFELTGYESSYGSYPSHDDQLIEFASSHDFFLTRRHDLVSNSQFDRYDLYTRDKMGSFNLKLMQQYIPTLSSLGNNVLANDNITWFDGRKFLRFYDFQGTDSGPLNSGVVPYMLGIEELPFKEGKITWLSKDIKTGLFNFIKNGVGDREEKIGQIKIEQDVYFEESIYVKNGWIKPWRNPQPNTTARTNPVKNEEPKVVKPTGKYYALVIGVSQYDDPSVSSLARPKQDAQKLRDILVSKYEFGAKEATLLLDATREQIITELNRLRKVITPNDNLLIFYAGHGKWDEAVKQGYWLPRNASWNNEANWISNSDIKEQIRAIQSGHTLLISDACFSGGIFRSRNAESIRTADYDIIALYKMPSRRAMTSGTMSTVPDNSVFFDYLTKRLSENEEKFLPSTTLFDSFRRAVINNTMMVVPQDGVIAETGDEGGDFIFIKKD